MNVLGLDLSITGTGVAEPDGRVSTIKGDADDGDQRLLNIVRRLAIVHVNVRIDIAVLENIATNAKVYSPAPALVHGAVRLWLMTKGIPYVLVSPTTLKAFATGRGKASKTDMAVAALKRSGREFNDDNQCDAWWLRQAGLHRYGTPECELPAAQRARLDVVAWPTLGEVVL